MGSPPVVVGDGLAGRARVVGVAEPLEDRPQLIPEKSRNSITVSACLAIL